MRDLQVLAARVSALIEAEVGEREERPAFVLIFADPDDNKRVNYTASTTRQQGIDLLKQTATQMGARLN